MAKKEDNQPKINLTQINLKNQQTRAKACKFARQTARNFGAAVCCLMANGAK